MYRNLGHRAGALAPAGSTTGSAKQRADVVIGPYGMRGEPHRPPTPAERLCQRLQGIGEGRSGNHPLMSINFGQSLSHGLWPCQLPLHKGAFGDGDADCRVGPAGLLAMIMVFCHSEASAYTGRGNPSFLRWTGVWAAGSSDPTESPINHQASRRAAKRPRQRPRGMGGNRRWNHQKGTSFRDRPGSA